MTLVRFVCLCTLAAFPMLAQIGNGRPVVTSFGGAGTPFPEFHLRAEPASPSASVTAGYAAATRMVYQSFGPGHRYFYDHAAHVYYGYDVVLTALQQQPNTYRVMFLDLSIGPPDFTGADLLLDGIPWTKLTISPLPASKMMKAGDTLDVEVFTDPRTGQKLIDTMSVVVPIQIVSGFPQTALTVVSQGRTFVFANRAVAVSPPTVSGPAREFSVDDAELRLQQARVTLNGEPQQLSSPSRLAAGSLFWFYLPNHGRFILSLSPRKELGFTKAGEVRGGVVTFTLGKDEIKLESPAMIAPGDAPYILFVLHDADWAPTAQGQSGSLLLGSVSPGELAALTRK